MASTDPCVVVLQLTGGNDYLNTTIPYNNPLYRDNRAAVGIPDNNIIHLDANYGMPDYMAPMKKFWDENKLAVLHGVGFKDSPRSHFRAMDIWHTCEPEKVGTEGWLGRVAREFDPNKENVVQVVSMGPSLPRSLVCPGVPVACVAGRSSATASCRRCRAMSGPMYSTASPICTARRSAAARSWII